ncbi:MAG: SRPBCC family protein [Burkholderiaceae bacterium]
MTAVTPYTISRVFKAPRALVWAVHTTPEHMARWLSPRGFHTIHAAMDFRVGGTYHYGIEGPGGMQMWGKQVYLELVPEEKIVLLQSFSDKDGGIGRHPMSPAWPAQMHATTTFEDAGPGLTRLTIDWHPHDSDAAGEATFDAARAGMEVGFGGSFMNLDDYLVELQAVSFPAPTDMVFTRDLPSPRARVWQAYTDPAVLPLWRGPEGFTNTTHHIDLRTGGQWKLTMHGPDGIDYPNLIHYLAVEPPALLQMDHGDFERVHFRNEITFTESATGTRLVTRISFDTAAARDATAGHAVPGHASTMRRLQAWLAAG